MKILPENSLHHYRFFAFLLPGLLAIFSVTALICQPVTGVWRGKITRGSGLKQTSGPVEIKLIASGDSIVGTAYYYGAGKSYIRYSLKGYFDPEDGSVKWQDYHMIDLYPKNAKGAKQFGGTMKYSADYSCPDGKILRLDGKCKLPEEPEMSVELKKMDNTFFPDEWDEVIDGYYAGMNRKEVVDSVWAIVSEPYLPKTATGIAERDIAVTKTVPEGNATLAPPVTVVKAPPSQPVPVPAKPVEADSFVAKVAPPKPKPSPKPTYPEDITAKVAKSNAERGLVTNPPANPPKANPPAAGNNTGTTAKVVTPPVETKAAPPANNPKPVMEQAFNTRKKIVQTEIPVEGDTLELRFYDNAQVDGDSISLFLNGKILFQHVLLGTQPYIFRLAISGLSENSELTMVAENLGAIPPNTAYMEAIVSGQRYTARLESTENSSGVVRLVRKE
jgi:hypothetical protein